MKSRAFVIALAFAFVWQTSLEVRAQQIQRLPATETFSTISRLPPANAFPALPPPPEQLSVEPLPSLEEELARHGGSSLYAPEGEYLNEPRPLNYLQYETPQQSKPWTGWTEFQGAAPIEFWPGLHWPGCGGYQMEPRFVGYGEYQLFADAFEEDGVRQDGIGHQLLAELDLRLTGTERFHVQFRPLGKNNTGGSFYQFNSPSGYVDNATAEPQLYWFEMELASVGGAFFNPFRKWDVNLAVGKVPYALHNDLLLKAEFLGIAVSKNNFYCGRLSNLNIQAIHSFNDLDAFDDADGRLYAAHANVDCSGYHELTTAFVEHPFDDARHRYYAAYSRTVQRGRCVLAGRAMFKFGDSSGGGSGELYVLEANRTSLWDSKWMGIEQSAVYMTAYHATAGWAPISGGGFDRLRSSFSVNPLISIARQGTLADNFGATLGVQLFRNGTDEHWIPELAFEQPGGVNVWGCGMRWLRKTSASSFVEVFGVLNFSNDPTFRREGIFAGHTWLF